MKVKIQIDTQTFVRFWLVVIAFGLAGMLIYRASAPLMLVLISFFLAMALNTPVKKIASYFPNDSRLIGTALAYVAIVAFLGVFVLMVMPPIVQQTLKLVNTIPELIQQNQDSIQFLNKTVEKYHLETEVENTINDMRNQATRWIGSVTSHVVTSIGSILGFMISTLLVLVMTFLMLLEGPSWMKRLWSVYPDARRRKHHEQLVKKMYDVMVGYVNGQLAVAAISGAGAGVFVFVISFFIPEIPMNLALPTMAICGVLSLVPMFGATIAGILITLMLLLNSFPAAIIFAVYFLVYQQIENNFVAPVIQSRNVKLSALAVIIAVTVGTYMFGLVGGIVSIPIAGWIKVLVEDFFEQKKNEHVPVTVRKNPLDKLRDLATKAKNA